MKKKLCPFIILLCILTFILSLASSAAVLDPSVHTKDDILTFAGDLPITKSMVKPVASMSPSPASKTGTTLISGTSVPVGQTSISVSDSLPVNGMMETGENSVVETQQANEYKFVMKWGGEGSGNNQLYYPYDLALDSSGNVYVADTYNHRIQKFSSTGTFIKNWGGKGSENGTFNMPRGITVDSANNVYVSDGFNNRIQKFTSDGNYITKWGEAGSEDGKFNFPRDLSVDRNNNVYVADWGNHRIQKFSSDGSFIMTWGSFGTGNGMFNNPVGIAVNAAGTVYVSDSENNRIQAFSSSGTFIQTWGTSGSGEGTFSKPYGVATDSGGNVFVVDYGNNRIQKFSSTGTFITKFGGSGIFDGQFISPGGVAVDAAGNVFLTEISHSRIHKFGPSSGSTPSITGISPGSGQKGGKYTISIIGKNFEKKSVVKVSGTGVTVGAYKTRENTRIVVPISIAAGAKAGTRIVKIINPSDGKTATGKFIIKAGPTIKKISPNYGVKGKKYTLTITGTNFEKEKSTITISGTGVTKGSYKARTTTKIVVPLTISKNAQVGMRTITVKNPKGGGTVTGKFIIKGGSSSSPSEGSVDQLTGMQRPMVLNSNVPGIPETSKPNIAGLSIVTSPDLRVL